MKAVRVIEGAPTLVEADEPNGDDVLVKVASASICGSDFHLMKMGAVEGRIIGHEFAGTTPDGTAVAIEPTIGCGLCDFCVDGERRDCTGPSSFLGVKNDGGMAEYVMVAPSALVELPSGLDAGIAAITEPLSVAAHMVRRVEANAADRVAVIGAGAIGLAVTAILRDRGVVPTLFGRHEHQLAAGQALGAQIADSDGFDVVIDAVGTTSSIRESVDRLKPRGRIGLVGSLWEPATIDMRLCSKEATIVAAAGFSGVAPNRDFDVAARVLAESTDIADLLVTHRFPLDAAVEGFAAAQDRAGGAIKVLFEI